MAVQLFALLVRRDIGSEETESAKLAAVLVHVCMLDPFSPLHSLENRHNLVVTSLSWHPDGHSLFVAYGVSTPHGYCSDPGLMCQWLLSQPSEAHSEVLFSIAHGLPCIHASGIHCIDIVWGV
jgi:hypothetical protein